MSHDVPAVGDVLGGDLEECQSAAAGARKAPPSRRATDTTADVAADFLVVECQSDRPDSGPPLSRRCGDAAVHVVRNRLARDDPRPDAQAQHDRIAEEPVAVRGRQRPVQCRPAEPVHQLARHRPLRPPLLPGQGVRREPVVVGVGERRAAVEAPPQLAPRAPRRGGFVQFQVVQDVSDGLEPVPVDAAKGRNRQPDQYAGNDEQSDAADHAAAPQRVPAAPRSPEPAVKQHRRARQRGQRRRKQNEQHDLGRQRHGCAILPPLRALAVFCSRAPLENGVRPG